MIKIYELIHSKDKGQVIVLVAISLVVIFALAALAIDVGISYSIRAKLNAAVDGAALAAGRGVKQGTTNANRVANAQAEAVKFFNANYPSDYMKSTLSSGPTTNVKNNNDGSWTISVAANATPPLYFARAVGWNRMNVHALAETTVHPLDMMLVLDCSGSLGTPTSPSTTFPRLKAAAINFINRFSDSPGGDRLGLVSFASGAVLEVPIDKSSTRGFNKTSVTSHINALTVGGSTASGEAMRMAKADIDLVPVALRSPLRVIVFFSDGAPNDVAGTFANGFNNVTGDLYSETDSGGAPYRIYQRDQRDSFLGNYTNISNLPTNDWTGTVPLASYDAARTFSPAGVPVQNNRCNVNRAARNMLENVANQARSETGGDAITVMTLGLGTRLDSLEIDFCGYNVNVEKGSNILRRLANTTDLATDSDPVVSYNASQPTGLYCHAVTDADLDSCFQAIANQILRLTK